VIRLDAATVLLQWSTGALGFLWVTTRHREVSLGYGWTVRGPALLLALGALAAGLRLDPVAGRELGSAAVVAATAVALGASIVRRRTGVRGQRAELDRRSARVAAMTGIDREAGRYESAGREFEPRLDLIAPAFGAIGLVAAGWAAADGSTGDAVLSVARTLVGAAFLGAVTDAMLLGHWYLVQPGLPRRHLRELVRWSAFTWPAEVVLLLVPTGMVSVWTGAVDDGWSGQLGWFWGACAVTTIALYGVTVAALRERSYSAVMAATGLLYLAILTAFGTDLVARAVLSG
jgi:hypothetical protein